MKILVVGGAGYVGSYTVRQLVYHDPESQLIPIVLQTALGQRDHIGVFGDDYPTPDGSCIRDYIHVDDLADAHLKALDLLEPGSNLQLNLGTGMGCSVNEAIQHHPHGYGD